MPAKNASDRALIAKIAAATRWSQEPDRKAATAAARKSHDDKFVRQVDPDGVLPLIRVSILTRPDGRVQQPHV